MIYLLNILPVFVLPTGNTLLLVLGGLRFRRQVFIYGVAQQSAGLAVRLLSAG